MRSTLTAFAFLFGLLLSAQVPQAFDFQGVARDLSGNVTSSQAITLRVSIVQGIPTGPVAYQETHSVTTGPFGLFSVAVGAGTPVQGSFTAIAWASNAHFLHVEMDATGGSVFQDMGTTQLLSVPYALHAATTDCFTVSLLGDTLHQGNGCHVIIPGLSAANGGCLDLDADGFYDRPGCGPVDCDDAFADTNPGSSEICGDGRDNDCDGAIDNDLDPGAHVEWHPDSDADGYGNGAITILACAQPAGHVPDGTDCDDADANVFPGSNCSVVCSPVETAWVSANFELYKQLLSNAYLTCLSDPDPAACMHDQLVNSGVPLSADCNTCGFACITCVFQNCLAQCVSGQAACDACANSAGCTAGLFQCFGLLDNDGDGWPAGADCNDNDASINPGTQELCNGFDDNCNGLVDDDEPFVVGPFEFHPDLDNDGWGNTDVSIFRCSSVAPPGMVPATGGTGDCNDDDPTIFPGAQEICDIWDNNCDGVFNEPNSIGELTWYADQDGDGFGDPANSVQACDQPFGGFVENSLDCNDLDPSVNPDAIEICFDLLDNDCDGVVDEQDQVWYQDLDGDGYGNTSVSEIQCTPSPGFVAANGDCDDTNSAIHPNASEVCGNGVDDDCDGLTDENFITLFQDLDGDNFGLDAVTIQACGPQSGYAMQGGDCDDSDFNVSPGSAEVCDGVDNDCDGLVDGNDPDVFGDTPYFQDQDGDGWGTASFSFNGCSSAVPQGYSATFGDCDDNDANVFPGQNCFGLDCGFFNGTMQGSCGGNEQCVFGFCIPCRDIDNDGVTDCDGDCNDNAPNVNPLAIEVCDGVDNDCDGSVDEGGVCTGLPEICNGIDDDGDGLTDAADPSLVLVPCELQTGVCSGVQKTADLCIGGIWTTCATSTYQIGSPAFEVTEASCDGLDNDCNGQVDEGNVCD